MTALFDEFLASLETAGEGDFAALKAAGVSDAALSRLPIPDLIGAGPVRPLAGGLYEPIEEGGTRAWIFATNLLGTFSTRSLRTSSPSASARRIAGG